MLPRGAAPRLTDDARPGCSAWAGGVESATRRIPLHTYNKPAAPLPGHPRRVAKPSPGPAAGVREPT
ncbi:hypothetical protein SZ55_1689 [Pseudomonas sp. FeS53a]|nr:hypothetical protein SZ55_1689 [Pseudomonas sp. FeS53a]